MAVKQVATQADKNWFQRHKWLALFLAMVAVFILTLPFTLKGSVQHAIYKYTHPYGIEKVSLKNIDLNIFKGTLLVNKLRLYRAESEQPITEIRQLEIDLKLTQLLQNKIYIKSLNFDGANLPLTLADDKTQLFLAGIPLIPDAQNTAEESKSNVDFGIEHLSFSNIQTSLTYAEQTTRLTIDKLSLNNLYSWQQGYGRLILAGKLNDRELRSNLQLHLFNTQPKVIGTFKIDELDSQEFNALLPKLDFTTAAKLKADITFTAEVIDGGFKLFQQGQIDIKEASFKQDQLATQVQALQWKGDLLLTQTNLSQTDKTSLELDGDLSLTAPSLKQDTMTIKLNQVSAKGQTQIELAEAIQVALTQNININQLNFTQADLTAKGNLAVNTQAKITLQGDRIEVDHQGAVNLSQFKLNQAELQAMLEKFNSQGSVKVVQNKNTQISLNQKINATQLAVKEPSAELDLSTNMTATAKTKINLNAAATQIDHAGDINLTNIQASQADLQAQIQETRWQGQANLTMPNVKEAELGLKSTGNLALKQANLKSNNQQKTISSLNSLKVADINLSSLKTLSLKQIQLNQLTVGDKANNNQLTQVGDIYLSSLAYQGAKTAKQQDKITLGTLKIANSDTQVSLTKESKITQLEELMASLGIQASADNAQQAANTEKPVTKNTNSTAEFPIQFSLEKIEVSGNNPITVSLNNITPAVNKQLHLENFTLGKISTTSPNQVSDYNLKVRFDEFSQLHSQGQLTPLNPTSQLQAKTELDDFSLLDISGLSEGAIGYQIKSGQLSAKLETEIKSNKIDAKNDVRIHKLEVASGESELAQKRRAEFPLPLETGLAMLQDKNNNIKLDVPIKGDLDNPNFNINDIINTALGKAMAGATRTYLLLALQPFGAIALAGEMAIDKAGALSLEGIRFTLGSNQLTPSMNDYLAKLAKLLKEKKGIQIKLCDGVLESERDVMRQLAIQQQIADSKAQNKPELATKEALEAIQISDQQMLELAAERQKQIKRELINLGVKSSQVVICKASILNKDKKTQVNLKI